MFFPMPHVLTNQLALLKYAYVHICIYIYLYVHIAYGMFKSVGEEISCSVKVRDQRVNALPERQ